MAEDRKLNALTTGAMVVAALVALAGFGYQFSMLWGNAVVDPESVLRVATDQYIAGKPIVAGKLAEKVSFATDPQNLLDDSTLSEDSSLAEEPLPPEDADAEPKLSEEEIAAQQEVTKKQRAWVSVRDFLVGAGKYVQAQEVEVLGERRQIYHQALEPLLASRKNGFPPGRKAKGNRMLGEVLFELAEYDQAAKVLRQALMQDPTSQWILLPMIAQAELRSTNRDPSAAISTIETFLHNTNLDRSQRWQGELILLRCFLKGSDYKNLHALVDDIRSRVLETDLLMEAEQADFLHQVELISAIGFVQRAIVRFGSVPQDPEDDRSAAIEMLDPAIQTLSKLQREANPKTASEAQLWNARALFCTGESVIGLSLLTALRQQRPFQGKPLLGGLEELEWLASEGRGTEMLQTLRYMIREIRSPDGLDVTQIKMDELKRRMIGAIGQLRDRGDFPNAIDASRSLPPVFEQASARTQEGITYRQWAVETLRDGKDVSGELTRAASMESRTRFRAAGDAFFQAAQLQFDTPEYVPALWAAIEAYQRGRHFRRSLDLLENYQRYESRQRLPRGLVAYGRALLAEGQVDRALQKLETCMVEYPRDPLRYDARLLAAQGLLEKQDFDAAKNYLIQNLQDGELTPQSPAWRDSLFTLGELLYERAYQAHLVAEHRKPEEKREHLQQAQQDLFEAIRYLDESVERYWPQPRAEAAAYLSSRSHVLSSRWPQLEAQSPEILEAARRVLRSQAEQELQAALEGFSQVKRHLLGREEEFRLPKKEQHILRNCYIAEAETLKEMSKFDEAANAFRAIELRYINEPLTLEAILGRASCARELGRESEADLLIQQASVVLDRIPPDWNGRFSEMTRFDRQGWQQYLGWMANRLTKNTTDENS